MQAVGKLLGTRSSGLILVPDYDVIGVTYRTFVSGLAVLDIVVPAESQCGILDKAERDALMSRCAVFRCVPNGDEQGVLVDESRGKLADEECPCCDGQSTVQELPCGRGSTCMERHAEWSESVDADDVVPLSRCVQVSLEESPVTTTTRGWSERGTRDTSMIEAVFVLLTIFMQAMGNAIVYHTQQFCHRAVSRMTISKTARHNALLWWTSQQDPSVPSWSPLGGGLLCCRGVWCDRPPDETFWTRHVALGYLNCSNWIFDFDDMMPDN